MVKDIIELTEEYASDDPLKWARLSSDVSYRRLHLLLLRDILAELRKLNSKPTDRGT
jgi:hypothetical protein